MLMDKRRSRTIVGNGTIITVRIPTTPKARKKPLLRVISASKEDLST